MTGPDLRAWRTAYQLTQQQAGELVGFNEKGAGNSWARLERSPKPVPRMLERLLNCISHGVPAPESTPVKPVLDKDGVFW